MPDLSDILDFITRYARAESKLCLDSRMVKSGDVFFAVMGGAHDGRDFIDIALKTVLPVLSGRASEIWNFLTTS